VKPGDGYELVDHNDVFQLGPRENPAYSDHVLAHIFHRTTRGGRSVVMTRPAVAELHAWLERWLAEGWDGVTRRCGTVVHEEGAGVGRWVCDKPPEPHRVHSGLASIWPTGTERTRRDWTT
jgi:hypothetical protein